MRKKSLLFLILFAAVCLTGCLREGVDTIALPFGKIPEGVIPQAIREQFEQYMPIYEGATPPNITGEYLVDPDLLLYTSDDNFTPGYQFTDMYIKFYSQTPSGMAKYRHRQGTASAEAPEVYVVGSDNNFTAYFIADEVKADANGDVIATCRMSKLISGTITENGIENYRSAIIMLEKDDPTDVLMGVNVFRVMEDGDGLAENNDWYGLFADKNEPSSLCIDKSATIK